jgi:aspartate aminotransferase-like enzyme
MILMTPGPTPVPEDVRYAMAQPSIHHRTPEFEAIFENTQNMLKKLFDMPEVLMLSSSGTGAMDSAISTFCNKKALVINAGKFGERFVKIAQFYNKEYHELKYSWDTPASINDIVNIIEKDKNIDSIFIQICESAGGLRHPIEQIAQKIKEINKDIFVIADGITAVGVEYIDTTNIDILISGSQKALMLPPGLALMGFSQYAIDKINSSSSNSFYFDLKKELKIQKKNTTAYTPATTIIIGLEYILEKIFKDGLDTLYTKTKNRSIATIRALESIGLQVYPKSPALSMSTIYHEKTNEINKLLKQKYNIHLAGGQDDLKGKIFRINNMGLIPINEISWVINAIELTLDELKIRTFDANANKVFLENIKKGLF